MCGTSCRLSATVRLGAERQWQPLWDDIQTILDHRLNGAGDDGFSHFLGAIVLEQVIHAPGEIPMFTVIDGQQRLTTLQLLLSAASRTAETVGADKEAKILERLTSNDELTAEGFELYKVWPTNDNRTAFEAVMKPGGPPASREDDPRNRIDEAYAFFCKTINDWLADEDDGASVFVGADGSRSYDTTAVAWATKAPDGRLDVDCRVFSVRDDVPHHVLHGGGTIDFGDVEGFLLELASRYDVREVRFDPRFLERSMEVLAARLPRSAVAPVEPYTNAHRQALAALERAVLEGTLRHRGDPAISQQVLAAACDRFDNGDVRRLRKLDRTRPIDAAVALALAVQGAAIEQPRSVYETRGVRVISLEA